MKPQCRQSGFSIVTAIFLLVILSMLGAFMLTISNAMHVSSAQDIQGSQAFRAARAGIEWGVASVKAAANKCYATNPTTLDPDDFDGYSVTVTCHVNGNTDTATNTNPANVTAYDEGGTNRYVFWLEATATRGGAVGSIGYIERKVNAFVEF